MKELYNTYPINFKPSPLSEFSGAHYSQGVNTSYENGPYESIVAHFGPLPSDSDFWKREASGIEAYKINPTDFIISWEDNMNYYSFPIKMRNLSPIEGDKNVYLKKHEGVMIGWILPDESDNMIDAWKFFGFDDYANQHIVGTFTSTQKFGIFIGKLLLDKNGGQKLSLKFKTNLSEFFQYFYAYDSQKLPWINEIISDQEVRYMLYQDLKPWEDTTLNKWWNLSEADTWQETLVSRSNRNLSGDPTMIVMNGNSRSFNSWVQKLEITRSVLTQNIQIRIWVGIQVTVTDKTIGFSMSGDNFYQDVFQQDESTAHWTNLGVANPVATLQNQPFWFMGPVHPRDGKLLGLNLHKAYLSLWKSRTGTTNDVETRRFNIPLTALQGELGHNRPIYLVDISSIIMGWLSPDNSEDPAFVWIIQGGIVLDKRCAMGVFNVFGQYDHGGNWVARR